MKTTVGLLQFFTKTKHKLGKKIWLVIPVLGALLWFGWSKLQATQATTPTYQTSQVEKGTLIVSVTSAGQVSTANSKTVSTKVSGVVKNVFVKNGQTVKSGDRIAEVDLDQESKQTYSQALASYQAAKNNLTSAQNAFYTLQTAMLGKWDTYKELSESDTYKDSNSANRSLPEFVMTQNDWLAAEAQYKNQQAVLTQAQTALNSAALSLKLASPTIYAPISGKVSGLSLQAGSVMSGQSNSTDSSTAQTLARIITDALPTITVNLTEIDVTKVPPFRGTFELF